MIDRLLGKAENGACNHRCRVCVHDIHNSPPHRLWLAVVGEIACHSSCHIVIKHSNHESFTDRFGADDQIFALVDGVDTMAEETIQVSGKYCHVWSGPTEHQSPTHTMSFVPSLSFRIWPMGPAPYA